MKNIKNNDLDLINFRENIIAENDSKYSHILNLEKSKNFNHIEENNEKSNFFILSIRNIFNFKNKLNLIFGKKANKINKRNFEIYYEEKRKIEEKMDIINYLKMTYKFEELIKSIEKINVKSDIFNYRKEEILLDI